MTTKKK